MRKGRSDTHEQSQHAAFDAEAARVSKSRGTVVAGRYVLERTIGKGGMASVYLAQDKLLDRPVALKMLRHELAHSAAMDRFTREIGVVSRLRHAHIVPLHDSGIHEGLPFYVMAYVEGESLHDRLKREHVLPPLDVARIGADVADALSYAHREGVMHRDITPGNILLADNNAYLADFGIARVLQDSDRVRTTASGFVLGTPTYMSPEQASGELDYDGRSDIYSLGCVLYEAVTGGPPFKGATPQAVIAGRFGPLPPPCDVVKDDVPAALGEAIAHAMALSPRDRYADAAEFAAALTAAVPAEPPRRRRSRRRRIARRATLAALLVSAAVGASFVARTSWVPLRGPMRRMELEHAKSLVATGEWPRADTALHTLVTRDREYAPAHLWAAQTGALIASTAADPTDEWKTEAALAAERRDSLEAKDRMRLDALLAYGRDEHPKARRLYERLVTDDPADVTTRLALADAYMNDSLVVPDSQSPSGWRFRGSYEAATRVLLGALGLRSPEPALRRAAYERLSRVLYTSSGRYRPGRALDGATAHAFAGFPSLNGDTLALVPYPITQIGSGSAEARNVTQSDAIERNRAILLRAAADWAADLPESADAHRAYAAALASSGRLAPEAAGAPGAITEIALARRLARDPHARLAIGAQGCASCCGRITSPKRARWPTRCSTRTSHRATWTRCACSPRWRRSPDVSIAPCRSGNRSRRAGAYAFPTVGRGYLRPRSRSRCSDWKPTPRWASVRTAFGRCGIASSRSCAATSRPILPAPYGPRCSPGRSASPRLRSARRCWPTWSPGTTAWRG